MSHVATPNSLVLLADSTAKGMLCKYEYICNEREMGTAKSTGELVERARD